VDFSEGKESRHDFTHLQTRLIIGSNRSYCNVFDDLKNIITNSNVLPPNIRIKSLNAGAGRSTHIVEGSAQFSKFDQRLNTYYTWNWLLLYAGGEILYRGLVGLQARRVGEV